MPWYVLSMFCGVLLLNYKQIFTSEKTPSSDAVTRATQMGQKSLVAVRLRYKHPKEQKKTPASVDLQGHKKAAPTGFEPVFQP